MTGTDIVKEWFRFVAAAAACFLFLVLLLLDRFNRCFVMASTEVYWFILQRNAFRYTRINRLENTLFIVHRVVYLLFFTLLWFALLCLTLSLIRIFFLVRLYACAENTGKFNIHSHFDSMLRETIIKIIITMTIIFRCVIPVCMAHCMVMLLYLCHVPHMYAFTRSDVCVCVYVCVLASDFLHVYVPL